MSFMRDVLSLVVNPSLADRGVPFKADVKARAAKYLAAVSSIGAYTESQGIRVVRDEVAAFLQARDGHRADPDNIFLTNGASEGVR